MRALRVCLVGLLGALALAACSGAGDDDAPVSVETVVRVPDPAEPPASAPAGGSLQDRLDARAGPDIALTMGNADFGVGQSRVSFLVIDENGETVDFEDARVYSGVVDTLGQRVDASEISWQPLSDAEVSRIAVAPYEGDGASSVVPDYDAIHVAWIGFDRPGRHWLLVEPEGSDVQAYGVVEVRERPIAPAVGDPAIPSENPTLADAPAGEISTAAEPDPALLQSTVKDALAARVPFVVTFATPAFCQTRACGPTVETLSSVARAVGDPEMRFIHVEIYEGNDPANGTNQWVREWRLPSEPWTFVVDSQGTIRDRFEGAFGPSELEAAVRGVLAG